MKIVLIGYMGSGKSAVGNELSEKLNFRFHDLDREIESAESKPINDIFSSKGEIYFRRKEAQVLAELIEQKDQAIIAIGGGTPCYGKVMSDLIEDENVITIYLKTSLEILTSRLFAERENRPLISHLHTTKDLNDFIRKHLFERSFYYNQADIVIDTEESEVSIVVENIVARLF